MKKPLPMLPYTLMVVGFILIAVNAFDYLTALNKIPTSLSALGIVFFAVGLYSTKNFSKR